VIRDDAKRNINQLENDPQKNLKLQEFKKYVKTGRLVSFWSNKDELSREVSTALHKQIDREKRPGWIRANNIHLEKITNELAECSKRIREFEEENSELREQVFDRKPELSIKLGIDVADVDIDEDKNHPEFFKTSPEVIANGTGLDIQIKKTDPLDYSEMYTPQLIRRDRV
jgi:predicted RNase H-like nuclease (RuvC/YqgF family)